MKDYNDYHMVSHLISLDLSFLKFLNYSSVYRGLAFLVDRAARDGGSPRRSGVHRSNISRVISGPLGLAFVLAGSDV